MTEADRRRHEDAKCAYAALMKFYPFSVEDLDGELWRTVPDYENYHVSNFGRVKSFYNGKVTILKPALNKQGYLEICLCKNATQKSFRVNRLVARAFIPNLDNKPQVNHIDGHKLNNYVGNLEWSTGAENSQHAFATGLAKSGEEHPDAKLTNEQVVYIRTNPDGLSGTRLAKNFNVTPTAISRIQLGKTYKNAGGTVRKSQKPPVPEEVRSAIRFEYKAGVVGCGYRALAKKYGVHQTTILNIVREK